MRESVEVVDERRPGESENLALSNFMAHEDRETGEILLHMSRAFARGEQDRTSPAYLYRISV